MILIDIRFLLTCLLLFTTVCYGAEKIKPSKELIEVTVGELEAFSAQEYAATERYKSAFEAATFYAH